MDALRVNLVEALKNHIKEKFYSPCFGECILSSIDPWENRIIISACDSDDSIILHKDGTLYDRGEVMLYPSKTNKDWIKWIAEHQPPKLTYNDVKEKLLEKAYNKSDECNSIADVAYFKYPDLNNAYNCTSAEQVLKLQAFNKLMNVQKFIEEGKQPIERFDTKRGYYFLEVNPIGNVVVAVSSYALHCDPYFSSEENAQRAIDILGKDVIKQALTTEW